MTERKERNNLVAGLILIALGIVALAGQLVDLHLGEDVGLLVIPAVGAVFMLAGILTRQAGLMVPGGIISGIGWGAYAVAGPFAWTSDTQEGGIFMLVFAAGWASITLFSTLFTRERAIWALIPAGIFALIGTAVFSGGVLLSALELIGRFWPAVLIVIGAYILLKSLRQPDKGKLEG
ncbi:MAG: hypothetical protein R3300_14860 [Candidatus Promineifilaceae bacterium]|nr:hypothetical protein [Candidatus Promineifilaceae bacterium]